jgi:hypothetical protein
MRPAISFHIGNTAGTITHLTYIEQGLDAWVSHPGEMVTPQLPGTHIEPLLFGCFHTNMDTWNQNALDTERLGRQGYFNRRMSRSQSGHRYGGSVPSRTPRQGRYRTIAASALL